MASILFNIGKIYERNGQLFEAKGYFTEALCLLNRHKRKGRLYAQITYYAGLINYRQSLYRDALEYFDLAITEQQAVYDDYHPDIAEMRMNIGQFQLEIGKLEEAMDNFLEALIILRMTFGNNHSKVAECLYGIGLIHEAKSEFSDSINVFN